MWWFMIGCCLGCEASPFMVMQACNGKLRGRTVSMWFGLSINSWHYVCLSVSSPDRFCGRPYGFVGDPYWFGCLQTYPFFKFLNESLICLVHGHMPSFQCFGFLSIHFSFSFHAFLQKDTLIYLLSILTKWIFIGLKEDKEKVVREIPNRFCPVFCCFSLKSC